MKLRLVKQPSDKVETGMLASAETIEVIAKLVTKYKIPALVVDPVKLPEYPLSKAKADKGNYSPIGHGLNIRSPAPPP